MATVKTLSKIELRKHEAVEDGTPEGHLALVMHDEKSIKEMLPAAQETFWKLRNLIVHLMHAHNRLLDSSASTEVKQAAASIEVAIDAKIEAMDAFVSKELDFVRNVKPAVKRAAKRVAKKRGKKLSKTARAKAMRKMRRDETPKQKRARLDKRNAQLKAWNERQRRPRLKRAKSRAKASK